MAPQLDFEFVILKLTYASHLHSEYPRITQTQTKQRPKHSIPHLEHWFDLVIGMEKSKIPANRKVLYHECDIMTSREDLFTINDYRFTNFFLIMGEQTMYWVYHHNNPVQRVLHGCGRLVDNFCSCCFHEQYLTIMETVKRCVMKTFVRK